MLVCKVVMSMTNSNINFIVLLLGVMSQLYFSLHIVIQVLCSLRRNTGPCIALRISYSSTFNRPFAKDSISKSFVILIFKMLSIFLNFPLKLFVRVLPIIYAIIFSFFISHYPPAKTSTGE